MAELTPGAIDAERLSHAARDPRCGAIVVFHGTTRDHHEGRRVRLLHYEAYQPMALAALEDIERTALARHDIVSCRIVHRLGEVPIGETSVVVVVAAVHRAPAFEACRWAMDELKRHVPIWKRETFEGGEQQWVKGTPLA